MFWSLEKQAIHAGVEIGSDNFIASRFWSSEPYSKFDTFGKVVIGDYVYIGNDAQIMPGVTVGDNVLIAAGSIVTKSIPANVVAAGNPAKYICTIEEYIERNKRYNTDSKGLSVEEKKRLLLSLEESKFIRKGYLK